MIRITVMVMLSRTIIWPTAFPGWETTLRDTRANFSTQEQHLRWSEQHDSTPVVRNWIKSSECHNKKGNLASALLNAISLAKVVAYFYGHHNTRQFKVCWKWDLHSSEWLRNWSTQHLYQQALLVKTLRKAIGGSASRVARRWCMQQVWGQFMILDTIHEKIPCSQPDLLGV